MLTQSKDRQVVLVDSDDNQVGLMEIVQAHQNPGVLHRAISVFLWRNTESGKEILLQKRSKHKPLWPLYWSNTVCTHPFPDENYLDCAVRRLQEEMGIKISKSSLKIEFPYYYQADFNQQLGEHEITTVISGQYDAVVMINFEEVAEFQWETTTKIKYEIDCYPEKFTPWFKNILPKLY